MERLSDKQILEKNKEEVLEFLRDKHNVVVPRNLTLECLAQFWGARHKPKEVEIKRNPETGQDTLSLTLKSGIEETLITFDQFSIVDQED